MKAQPANVNYFFGEAYYEFWQTIFTTFKNCGEKIVTSWEILGGAFVELWADIVSVVTFDTPFASFFMAFWHAILFGLGFGMFVFNLVGTPVICVFFSLLHLFAMLGTMFFIYLVFMLLCLIDFIYRAIHKISSGCPHCRNKFSLPTYVCPGCGREHTQLHPSKYGIFKRECVCGRLLPTTFLNGRQNLPCICPVCSEELTDGGMHTEIWIPVLGGPSAGKTCFVNMAISQIERKVAPSRGMNFEYMPNGEDVYAENMQVLDQGQVPFKTSDMNLKFYQFHLTEKGGKVENFVSLCDVGGEVYGDQKLLEEQLGGYKNANGFVILVDPLSIASYREEVENSGVDVNAYGVSDKHMDEVLSMLLDTLDNLLNKSNSKVKNSVAVVFTKGDIPGLDEKIGESAVEAYMLSHANCDKWEARNKVCEGFLLEYDEANFINMLNSRFKSIQYFVCSALGHNVDGSAHEPAAVEESVLWLLDKASPSLDFSDIWGKKI